MQQSLKSVEIYRTVCNGTFMLAPKWLEIYLTSGIALNSPLIIEYTELGKHYMIISQIVQQTATLCRFSHDIKKQSCFGVCLYPDFNMIFNSDSERNAFIKDLEGLVKKAGYPDFKIL